MWQLTNLCNTKQYCNKIEFLMLSLFRAAEIETAEMRMANKGMQRATVWGRKQCYPCTGTGLSTAVFV